MHLARRKLQYSNPVIFPLSLLPFTFSLLTFNFSLRPHRDTRGFTLLEILVALAVLSIVVLGFLRGNSALIANADYLRQKTMAHWVAMNRAAELRLAGQWLSGEGAKGVALMGDQRWRWQASGRVSPDPEIQIINIEVRPEDRETTAPLANLTMFLGKPPATLGTSGPTGGGG